MPEIRSLISVSSSTTRMSDAMGHSLFLLGALGRIGWSGTGQRCGGLSGRGALLLVTQRQIDAHRGPFDLSVAFRRIGERERPAMLLGNPLHDRQAEPSALGAGGHVRLDQALAILLGQAAAIVDDGDVQAVAFG